MDAEKEKNQYHEFAVAARGLECDESEERFNAVLSKIVRHKPRPEAPPEKAPKPEKNEPAK